jgi:FAD/FMN-containing dehydrogenase
MNHALSRRSVLHGIAAGALVLGFDPTRRSWVTAAQAATGAPLVGLPSLDGSLRVDAGSIQQAADDFGHIVHRTPLAVLEPGSVEDIARIIRFARGHGLRVAMRGQGHATFGQAQVQGGIVVDSSALATIHAIRADRAVVDAGVQWSALVNAAFAQGLTPPVLTDFQGLSVGGTLSLGGIGGTASHFGAQVDNVFELEVVTGRGEILTCSPERHPMLFAAVLAGLGQSAIIARATVRLVPAKTNAIVFNLFYADIATYVRDQRALLADGRFDYLEGQVVPNASGSGFLYMIEAASFFTPPEAPSPSALLAGLSDNAPARQSKTESYLDFAFRLDPLVAFLKSIGAWFSPHPFFSVFVPVTTAQRYVGDIVAHLTLADTGGGPVLFYPLRRDLLQRPLMRVPNEDFFTFNLLRFAPPNDPAAVEAMIAMNRALYDRAVAAGGTQYPLGSIPVTPVDWRVHYGSAFDFVEDAKERFDPDDVLTPGQGIFPTPPR